MGAPGDLGLVREHFGPYGKPKRRFDTQADARRYREANKANNKKKRPYLCTICHGWHLGRGKPVAVEPQELAPAAVVAPLVPKMPPPKPAPSPPISPGTARTHIEERRRLRRRLEARGVPAEEIERLATNLRNRQLEARKATA